MARETLDIYKNIIIITVIIIIVVVIIIIIILTLGSNSLGRK